MSGLRSLGLGYRAVVFGAGGGLGQAFVAALAADPACAVVHAGARVSPPAAPKRSPFAFDLLDEASIAEAARAILAEGAPDLVIVATGLLHDTTQQPERSIRAVSAEALVRSFRINAVGPALIARHLLPGLPRDRRAIFAALSARVGSIGDNRKGGWHAYRAAKAALNQLLRTAAIELAQRHPLALCIGLHPGTVDTPMSRPFQAGLPAGQLLDPARSVAHLLAVLDGLTPAQSGRVFAWDGAEVPP
jgi:NAD(P)-dependent dehydrogenase (short-subunit alcohol dehydrogenase family)